jgi:hypothetical protein
MQTLALTDVLAIDDQHRGKEPALAVPALIGCPLLKQRGPASQPKPVKRPWPIPTACMNQHSTQENPDNRPHGQGAQLRVKKSCTTINRAGASYEPVSA